MNNSPEFSRRGDTPEQPEQLPGPDIQISGMRASEFSNILSSENDTILAKHVIVRFYVIYCLCLASGSSACRLKDSKALQMQLLFTVKSVPKIQKWNILPVMTS